MSLLTQDEIDFIIREFLEFYGGAFRWTDIYWDTPVEERPCFFCCTMLPSGVKQGRITLEHYKKVCWVGPFTKQRAWFCADRDACRLRTACRTEEP